MKIVHSTPPNIEIIKLTLPVKGDEVFCYGDTIYNPSGNEVPAEVEYHEHIHSKQQGDNPEMWWYNYLTSKSFRLAQELEAYGEQYRFISKHIKIQKLVNEALERIALALSGKEYGNLISFGEAKSKIRRYGKQENR